MDGGDTSTPPINNCKLVIFRCVGYRIAMVGSQSIFRLLCGVSVGLSTWGAFSDQFDQLTPRKVATSANLRAVTFGNGVFVAVGSTGAILTSSDSDARGSTRLSQTRQPVDRHDCSRMPLARHGCAHR